MMENTEDIRWVQRFSNYNKALEKLDMIVRRIKNDFYRNAKFDEKLFEKADDIIVEGLIQRFEYTHELAWNVMKDFLEARGNKSIYGSRDATRDAFQVELILDGDTWMDMIKSRNKSSHTYNEDTANEIFLKTIENYHPAFIAFQSKMQALKEESL